MTCAASWGATSAPSSPFHPMWAWRRSRRFPRARSSPAGASPSRRSPTAVARRRGPREGVRRRGRRAAAEGAGVEPVRGGGGRC